MSELDSRKQTILRAIVLEYVTAAEPIASEALVQKYDLGVKSATVRNEMAELSDMGYLEQPHTSAGRIPSDLGYRFYVDRLIEQQELSVESKAAVEQTWLEGEALQSLLRETLRALTRITHLLGVATTSQDMTLTVRTAIVSALGPTQALLVLALSNGHVENKLIECPINLSLQDIGQINEILTRALVGQNLQTILKTRVPKLESAGPLSALLATVWVQVQSITQALTRGKVLTEGEEYMFAQPEFSKDVPALFDLLKQLTEGSVLYNSVAPSSEVVTIGKENKLTEMQRFSVVRRSYFVGDTEVGVIALVGPTRMLYERSIPLVNFTADALSQSLTKFFG